MEEILKTIIENLVENKDAITIEKVQEVYKEVYKINVDKEEMGRVIGKQGKIAKAIRTIAKSLGAKDQKKVEVEFVEDPDEDK